eukprot:scaffold5088_cov98-Cylindrotheca_fusiformis.AAC.9
MAVQNKKPSDFHTNINKDDTIVEESVHEQGRGMKDDDEWESTESGSSVASDSSELLGVDFDTYGTHPDSIQVEDRGEESDLQQRARIAELEAALAASEKRNLDIVEVTQYYEEKLQKLHRSQTFANQRMVERVDALEEELMKKSMETETAESELKRAVEKIMMLQEELAEIRINPVTVRPQNKGRSGLFTSRRWGSDIKTEEKPDSDTDEEEPEVQFEELNKEEVSESPKETQPVEEDTDPSDPEPSTSDATPRKFGRFFSFGQKRKQKQSSSEPSIAPSADDEFYDCNSEKSEEGSIDESLLTQEEKTMQNEEPIIYG